jgi:hypothetical protein
LVKSVLDSAAKFFQQTPFSFRFKNFSLQRCWSRRFASTNFFVFRDSRLARGALSVLDRVEQSRARKLAIHRLRTRILDCDDDSTRAVPQCHGGRDFVYVLTAGTAGAGKGFFKIDVANAKPDHPFCDWMFHKRTWGSHLNI